MNLTFMSGVVCGVLSVMLYLYGKKIYVISQLNDTMELSDSESKEE